MRLVAFTFNGTPGTGLLQNEKIHGWLKTDRQFPGDPDDLLEECESEWSRKASDLVHGRIFPLGEIRFRVPLERSRKIICVGLNYRDHTAESGYKQPEYPTLFARFTSSLVAHKSAIIRPEASCALDFEGELVAVIGRGGRHITREKALAHIAGYSIFNDATIRDFQHRTPQWTIGKNFDGTGAFGPTLVTPDELPLGAHGLSIQTRLNGELMQSSNTEQLIFNVANLVQLISEAITLAPGDMIVTGTPSGIGHMRAPKVYMKPGDIVEVQIQGIGTLRNSVVEEMTPTDYEATLTGQVA